jgi:hypothetical protein
MLFADIQRRHEAEHIAGGAVDERPAAMQAFTRSLPGLVSFMPIISPWPRTSAIRRDISP